jgi:hypothetical protein
MTRYYMNLLEAFELLDEEGWVASSPRGISGSPFRLGLRLFIRGDFMDSEPNEKKQRPSRLDRCCRVRREIGGVNVAWLI